MFFFEFGNEKKIMSKNGKERIQKDWSIWIGDASWRISKNGAYVVGSNDSPQAVQSWIQNLLGKRFQSMKFISSFLDVEFNFCDEYKLTTFFNWSEENQWTLFLPDDTSIEVNCSSDEKIKENQKISKKFLISEHYLKLNAVKPNACLTEITYNKYMHPTFYFDDETSIDLQNCAWRLENNKNYLVGSLDDKKSIKMNMLELVGNKLKQIDIANYSMDARFQFENQYVINLFSCCYKTNQWTIFSRSTPIFHAHIDLFPRKQFMDAKYSQGLGEESDDNGGC